MVNKHEHTQTHPLLTDGWKAGVLSDKCREVNKYRKADKQAKIPTSGKSGNSVEKEITGQPMQRDGSKDK